MTTTRHQETRRPLARVVAHWSCPAVVVLLVAGCSMAGSSGSGDVDPTTAVPTATPTAPAAVLATFDVGGDGWAMQATGDHLWIQVDPPVDAIVRVDKHTGEATAMVPGGHRTEAGPSGPWVSSGDWVVKVDPSTGKQSLRVPHGGAFAIDAGSGWIHEEGGDVYTVDLGTGTEKKVATVDPATCGSTKDIAMAFGVVWLACKEGVVVRVPLDGGKATVIPTAMGSHTFALTEDALWVTNYLAGSISRIDPATNDVSTIDGIGSSVGITAGGGYVWSADSEGIARIDPASGRIVGHLAVPPGSYYELVWDDGVIWASTRSSRLLKIDATS
jgi:hypothetical protein